MNDVPLTPQDLSQWFEDFGGMHADLALWLTRLVAILILFVLAWLANALAKGIVLRLVRAAIRKAQLKFGEALVEVRFFHRLSHLAPAIVVKVAAGWLFADSETLLELSEMAVNVYLVIIGLFALDALFNAGLVIYKGYEIS